MAKDLLKLRKELKNFAKRVKNFKYTETMLITFLMTGTIVNLYSASESSEIDNQVKQINTSISSLKQNFKRIKLKNDKSIRQSNLELIQLMEQGEYVIKSPWNSWQYGTSEMYNDWHGIYTGRRNKNEKYPYEGIFSRSSDIYERAVSPSSENYELLGRSRNLKSATRLVNGYGMTSTSSIVEPLIGFEVNAGINPRQILKNTITLSPRNAIAPNTPTPISFNPTTPSIPTLTPPNVDIQVVSLNTFENNLSETTLEKNSIIDNNNTYTLNPGDQGLCFINNWRCKYDKYIHEPDRAHDKAHAILEITGRGLGFYTGENVTFVVNASGERGISFDPMGSSSYPNMKYAFKGTLELNAVNTAGMELTTQHNAVNVTAINEGKINGNADKQSAFTFTQEQNPHGAIYLAQNDGIIKMTGATSTGFSFYVTDQGWIIKAINNRMMTLSGDQSYGIGLSTKVTLPNGIIKNNDVRANSEFKNNGGTINISGKKSGGIAVQKQATSRPLIVENTGTINVSGDESFGMYSELQQDVANDGTIELKGTAKEMIGLRHNNIDAVTASSITNNGTITISSTGANNVGLFTNNGKVINAGSKNVKVTAGKNVGMVVYGNGKGENAGKIDVTSPDASIGVISAEIGNTGATITNTGTIKLNSAGNGSVGVIVGNSTVGGSLDSTSGTIDVTVTGDKSVGVFSNGSLKLGQTNVTTNNGAINFFEGANTSSLTTFSTSTNSTATTGQGSLLFYSNGGKFKLDGTLTAGIAGGTDVNTRGTAFYYTGVGHYAPFNSGNITTWANNIFNGTLNKLTLNMATGSRLFVASNVGMNLSNTTGATVSSATGANITGTDYKTFMLYLSKLTINQDVNLDNANDDFNQLEIANSSIDNNTPQTITGTQIGQVALAQENIAAKNQVDVTLNNFGKINLSGINSTGMYAKFGVLNNESSGKITITNSSAAMYGKKDSLLTNKGIVTAGSDSTAMYSEDTDQSIINNGIINITGDNSIALLYKPKEISMAGTSLLLNRGTINITGDKNVAMYATKMSGTTPEYTVENNGIITMENSTSLLNPNVAMYSDSPEHILKNSNLGKITTGKNTIAIYGYGAENIGNIKIGNAGIGIYSQNGDVKLTGGKITTGTDEAVGVYTVGTGQNISNTGTAFDIGDNSFGFVNVGNNNKITSSVANVGLKNKNVYVYSNDINGFVINSTNITSTGEQNYGLYSAGTVDNYGNIDLSSGKGSVAIYSIKGGTAINHEHAVINVGASDVVNKLYSIGMGAGYETTDTGNVINKGTINVNGKSSIAMYASGTGSTAKNEGNINLNANNTTGIYVTNGATAINTGTITTGPGTHRSVVGVYLGEGSTLNNTGTININARNGKGVYLKGGTVINYGNITVNGETDRDKTVIPFTTPDTGKELGGLVIKAPSGAPSAIITVNGIPQTPVVINTAARNPISVSASSIGMYVNTSGINFTNAINGLENLTSEADLIVGIEAAEMTDKKYILINDPRILDTYRDAMENNPNIKWNVYSGSLTWMATPTLELGTNKITSLYMAKIPYTAWAGSRATPVNSTDTYNFADGLEQRYGVKALGNREREIFTKLNSIGNNEEILLYQAFDEMMGHQYGNLQQRINATGTTLDKEFNHLRKDWRNSSKQNNKIKVFGIRDKYNTNTAGIIDYTSNAYGVVYVHEDEKVKMGNSTGWYAGAVTNRFKFKDIGHSKENQTMLKAGVFKTMSPKADHNGALQWTIGGDVFVGINDMKRRYLVVDEIFQAKSNYHSYGAAIKNELGYDIRMSERTHLRPYGSLKMEYGRFGNISEESGQMRLEVKGNDYFSMKPEAGIEFKYIQPLAARTNLSVGLTAAYENELGKSGSVNNKAKVKGTQAGWFGIRGEKEDRTGNGKFDLKVGVDNTRFGVTANFGYETKGKNVKGGIGLRAIF